jgi:hypothetical protein
MYVNAENVKQLFADIDPDSDWLHNGVLQLVCNTSG